MINYNTRQVQNAPNYFVTDCGKVFSYASGFYKQLKPWKNHGYPYVHIVQAGTRLKKSVHRMVAETFLPNPNNHGYVNHMDGSRDNNKASNLEWCTQSHNIKHALDAGKRKPLGSRHRSAKLKESDIPTIRALLKSGMRKVHIAKLYSVDSKTIRTIGTGETWSYVPDDINEREAI